MKHAYRIPLVTLASLVLSLAAGGAARAAAKEPGTHHAAARARVHPAAAGVRPEYVIGREDVLAIDVWREPEISRVEPVRPDGRITVPLAGEIEASGKTAGALEREIESRLSRYIHDPAVTVIVQQANSRRFNILGDVLRPGTYPLDARMSVLDAIAAAGGFREFANVTHIYVVRRIPGGRSARIRFNYKAAVRGSQRELGLTLQPGDTVIVP
jgi:polysaccharide export outer membrane protein